MFKRLHNRAEYSDSGMGFSICKKIVDAFDGKIWVESQAEKGSIFFIQFPKKQAEQNVITSKKEKVDEALMVS